jgi:hypothetical protein
MKIAGPVLSAAGDLGPRARLARSSLVAELHRKDHPWIAAAAVKTCGRLPFQFRAARDRSRRVSPSMSLAASILTHIAASASG